MLYKLVLCLRMLTVLQGEPVNYQLYGVLVHSGFSCNSGHYYCYVKAPNQTWYCMNDSHVSIQNIPSPFTDKHSVFPVTACHFAFLKIILNCYCSCVVFYNVVLYQVSQTGLNSVLNAEAYILFYVLSNSSTLPRKPTPTPSTASSTSSANLSAVKGMCQFFKLSNYVFG